MGFASTWLESGTLFPELIKEAPDNETGIIVIVPAFDEPQINDLLNSLAQCSEPDCKVEIIIVVNAPANASKTSLDNNIIVIKNTESWNKENKYFFRLFLIDLGQPSIPGWGVGLARKAGMDEAVRRFNFIDNPDGVIVNLDADCRVRKNYFLSIYSELLKRRERKACSIYFEHPVSGKEYSDEIYTSVIQYELHLRYYFQALSYTGFPYVFHTVGSIIAVKSLAYVRAGGMNRRQAGEDFYFVQKLVPAGGYFNLNSTTVYPSPRISLRVPFGTGPIIGRMVTKGEKSFMTYNLMAFKELHFIFGIIEKLYCCNLKQYEDFYRDLPTGLRSFLAEKEWISKITEIKRNTSGLISFRKRFFGWFNMFKVVKYLNYVHNSTFEKIPVDIAAYELLKYMGRNFDRKKPDDLLLYYRELEKNS
jgi:hypothetical protein